MNNALAIGKHILGVSVIALFAMACSAAPVSSGESGENVTTESQALVGAGCLSNSDCGAGEYCSPNAGPASSPWAASTCGTAGTCQQIPSGCGIESPLPVCGCDGRTYATPCDAATQGAAVAYYGECGSCTSNSGCAYAPQTFCKFQPGACMAKTGVCVEVPLACPTPSSSDKVCSCKGNKVYGSQCLADEAEVQTTTCKK